MNTYFYLLIFFFFVCIAKGHSQEPCYLKFMADSLRNIGRYDEAIERYKQISPGNPGRIDLYRIAECFCLKEDPDSAGYYYNLSLQSGFYYNSQKGPDSDTNLSCLKAHPDYERFSQQVKQNKLNMFKEVDSTLLNRFVEVRKGDQYYRNFTLLDSLKQLKDTTAYSSFLKKGKEQDRINMLFLDSVINVSGCWPGYNLVGREGDNAAWLIVQHADDYVEFQEKCLILLKNAWKEFNTNPHNVAYLYDRIMINKGLKQRYATQMRLIDGKAVFIDLEDEDRVEYRRSCFDLPPLSVYKKALEKRYTTKK